LQRILSYDDLETVKRSVLETWGFTIMNTHAFACCLAVLAAFVPPSAPAQAADPAQRDLGMNMAVGIGAAASAMAAPPSRRVYLPPPPAYYYPPPGAAYAVPPRTPYIAPPGSVIYDPYHEPLRRPLYPPPY